MLAAYVVAGCLVALGCAHSALGESSLLRPLFAAEGWELPGVPRWAAHKIFRFAWHITSIAWFAIAAIVLGANILVVVGVMNIITAAIIFFALRGHLAWPLFLLGGLAAFYAEGLLDDRLLRPAAFATAATLVAIAGVHIFWAAGGQWMLDRALPKVDGNDFTPGAFLTTLVAIAILIFAALVITATSDADIAVVRWLVTAGIGVFTIRAIGDTKVAGFTKTDHDSDFGKADDAYFTPIIVMIALGATGALLV